MHQQSDMFTGLVDFEEPDAEEVAAEPLAVPCGFQNRRNQPCRRLATRPLLLDGSQLVHRERPLLHCDPACFHDDLSEYLRQDDSDGTTARTSTLMIPATKRCQMKIAGRINSGGAGW